MVATPEPVAGRSSGAAGASAFPAPVGAAAVHPPLPSPREIRAVIVAVNMAFGLGFTAVVWIIDPGAQLADYAAALQRFVIGSIVVTSLISLAFVGWIVAPLERLRRALARGVDARDLSPAEVRDALLLCRPVGWMTSILWGVPAISWPVYALAFGRDEWFPMALAAAGSGLCAAILVGRSSYSVLLLYTQRRISPVLLSSGTIDHLQPLRLVRVWHHVIYGVLIVGLLMPATQALLFAQSAATTGVLIYVAATTFASAVLNAVVLLSNVSRTSGHLAGRMSAVRDGNLSVSARVENLDTFGQLASDFNAMVEGLRQREVMRETFGRYVSRRIADQILASGIELGGEVRNVTVLFSDIRGFTALSEHLPPQEVVRQLNRYLDAMVECVFAHGGVLDKFIGDAVLAVWGIPVGKNDPAQDAQAAVRCAIDMSAALERLNVAWRAEGRLPLDVGIGLHSGPAVAGNIGSQQFVQYTVIGDTVNLTSRLEGLTKRLGRRILVSSSTAALVGDVIALDDLGATTVRGRDTPVQVFGVAQPSAPEVGTPPASDPAEAS